MGPPCSVRVFYVHACVHTCVHTCVTGAAEAAGGLSGSVVREAEVRLSTIEDEGWGGVGGRKKKKEWEKRRERERERTREEGGVERRRGSGRERERARNHIEKEEEVRGGNSPLYLCGCRLVSHTPPCLAPPCLSAGGNVTSRTTRPYSSLEWKACY